MYSLILLSSLAYWEHTIDNHKLAIISYISDHVSCQHIVPHHHKVLKSSVTWKLLSYPGLLLYKLQYFLLYMIVGWYKILLESGMESTAPLHPSPGTRRTNPQRRCRRPPRTRWQWSRAKRPQSDPTLRRQSVTKMLYRVRNHLKNPDSMEVVIKVEILPKHPHFPLFLFFVLIFSVELDSCDIFVIYLCTIALNKVKHRSFDVLTSFPNNYISFTHKPFFLFLSLSQVNRQHHCHLSLVTCKLC